MQIRHPKQECRELPNSEQIKSFEVSLLNGITVPITGVLLPLRHCVASFDNQNIESDFLSPSQYTSILQKLCYCTLYHKKEVKPSLVEPGLVGGVPANGRGLELDDL